ncbi:hypothetical protein VTJ83DRAFT_1400 [Remersonia thermophila]|uniref:Clr5 domain-containing protein n=1 Tax=Remersonia thermophila TaxID=72144 RepID=A0ABR4DPN4_9PEZI
MLAGPSTASRITRRSPSLRARGLGSSRRSVPPVGLPPRQDPAEPTMPAPQSRLDWAGHRDRIERLYWEDNLQLSAVMKIMKEEHGFDAAAKTYKKRFKEWGWVKNCTTQESIAMYRFAEHRRSTENKETEFFRRGKRVKPANIRRSARRFAGLQGSTAQGAQDPHADKPRINP